VRSYPYLWLQGLAPVIHHGAIICSTIVTICKLFFVKLVYGLMEDTPQQAVVNALDIALHTDLFAVTERLVVKMPADRDRIVNVPV